GMDIHDIRLAHLAGDTFLWVVNFGDVPMVENSVFALYLDTDRNDGTGFRTEAPSPRRGTDLEVRFDQGKAVALNWGADGAAGASLAIPWFKKNRSLCFAIRLPVAPVRDTVSFDMAAECHSSPTPEKPVPAMKDTTRKAAVHRFKITPADAPGLDDDDDGDGLSNRVERDFCTDPKTADVFVPVIKSGLHREARRAEASYVAGMDILEVAACHVAEDRYLFRATFAGPPSMVTTTNILYLDLDNDRTTGRQMGARSGITGTDIMLGFTAGRASLSLHGADAAACGDGQLRYAVKANSLHFCADLPIKTTPAGAEFGIFMLTHTAGTPKPPMSDNTQRVDITGFARMAGTKRARAAGWAAVGGMSRAYGLDIIRPLLQAPTTVAVQYDKLELSGFDIDYYTTLEYGHIKALRPEATAACPAPKGRYHVGFMIFDRRNYGAKVGISVDGEKKGSAAINAANNNYWLYWLDEAVDFGGGELVELVALAGTVPLPINYAVFLPEPPQPREQSCKVDSLAFRVVPDGTGDVQVSWISENPVPTRLEYGPGDFSRVHESPHRTLLHRAVLRDLDKATECQARAVGRDLAGKPVYSETIRFTPARPPVPQTVAKTGRIPLVLNNPHPTPANRWLVRSGIPFPQGTLGSAENLRLLANGRPVQASIRETAHWPDYSVKWVLVTFVADCPAQAQTKYELEYGAKVQAPVGEGQNLARVDPNTNDVVIDTGAASFRITPQGELLLADGKPVRTHARPSSGEVMATGMAPATVTVGDNGHAYARVSCVVEFAGEDGLPVLTVTSRYEFWSGSPLTKLSHSFLVQGKATHSQFEEIYLDIPLAGQGWQAELKDGGSVELKASDNLYQREFKHYVLNGGEPVDGRFAGQFRSGKDVIVMRQFWELYPKGFRVAADGVKLDLCPDFAKGYYDSFPFDVNSTKYYFYLRNGQYRFRRGMRKTHEILLGTVADARAAQAAANAFQRPLLATAPAAWYCGSGAFYSVAPRNEKAFAGYERNVDRNMAAYRRNREKRGDYGMLNFGDWFGERGVHWGNGEYDNAAAFLLEYIRSGNEEAYHLATETEKHNRDVDRENWVPGNGPVGKVYIHQLGHNGGYYGGKSPKGADAWDRGGGSATHSWAEGHLWYYFLSGEEDARDAGLGTADYHIATGHANYYHLAGELRNPAWRLIMDAAAYSATYDPAYLNAAKLIMRTVYTYQDKVPRPLPDYQVEPGRTQQVGGWSRMMVPGHCHCEPRHRGNANFMIALLLSGIKYYHEMTGEPEAKEALIAGAYYLLDECYSEKVAGFRYTSCPKMSHRRGTIPYLAEGIARAYLWTGDKRFAHPLAKALPYGERGSAYGSGSYYRGGPRVLADMQALGLTWAKPPTVANGASNGPFKKPTWMTKAVTVVQAEDFKAQGEGECQMFGDREGAWGRIVTYWHADVGHWLEWEVEIPADGMYTVRFHYATDSQETARKFLVDGDLPCPEAKAISIPPSGGFGMAPMDWVYVSLRNKGNKDVPIRLSKGKHTIRMVNLKDGMAFDFMAFIPVKAD
ncbi:MAG: hypothetical protein HN904_27975, partial [Victivallales bacterium]|nr:hypothetical protein [Victivallales bacterium]